MMNADVTMWVSLRIKVDQKEKNYKKVIIATQYYSFKGILSYIRGKGEINYKEV